MRSTFSLAVALLVGCSSPRAGHVQPAGGKPAPSSVATSQAAAGIKRTLIDRKPAADLPGWETRLYLIEYPPGAAAPVHVHPAIGVGFVIDGRFESAFGDEPVVEVQSGHGFVDQAGVPHRVFRNPSVDHGLRFVVAYTLRAGEEPLHLVPATTVLNQPALFPDHRDPRRPRHQGVRRGAHAGPDEHARQPRPVRQLMARQDLAAPRTRPRAGRTTSSVRLRAARAARSRCGRRS
jgi:quercetin dioxygenase-like cupin family protein